MLAAKTSPLPVPAKRIRFLMSVFLLVVAVIIVRLFNWQVVKGEELEHLGKSQSKTSQNVGASRGSILASDGAPLVSSTPGWLAFANPKEIEDPKSTADKLAVYLYDMPFKFEEEKKASEETNIESQQSKEKTTDELMEEESARLLALLTKKSSWVALKQKIDNKTKEDLERLEIKGLGFEKQQRRSYPEGSMSAHLLGFVGSDASGLDQGYFGLEGKYDVALSGVGGEKIWEKDALGNPILSKNMRKIQALDGVTLKTHIDRTIQYTIEKKLKEGIEKYGAKSGSITVMRPSDGAILALAASPSYIPTHFSKFKEEDFINPVISQTFEPGSIFKVVVIASALDSQAVKLDDKCDICASNIKIGLYTIRTWDEKYHADSTPGEIIKNSDNIGMVWAAQKLGADRFYDYLSGFGFGGTTGIDLQGETSPKLKNKGKWGQIDVATASFGQGIAVTPIQIVRAVSAIANDGNLPTPQLVDKITGSGFEEDIKPEIKEKVISKKAADQITEMMINAVSAGEAKWAAPKGHVIAGKTGTAQVPIAGHYDPEKTIASFIGFAPADNPKFVMLVTLREPTSSPWASETAAPLWFSIAKDMFVHLGIPPTQ